MKKIICVVCLCALLMSACSVKKAEPTESTTAHTHNVFELTFETKLITNDSVGNDWTITYYYENQSIQSGFRFDQWVGVFRFHNIRVVIQEKDKIVDMGEGLLTVASIDGSSDAIEITVIEHGGKYEGNTAVWKVTCYMKLVDKKTIPTDHFPDGEQLASAGCFFVCRFAHTVGELRLSAGHNCLGSPHKERPK